MNLVDENGITALLVRYGFDLGGQPASMVVRSWTAKYDPEWLQIAIIESLHLGRYKAISVEQVLNNWQRRGQVTPHFSADFATMVTGQEISNSPEVALGSEEETIDAEIALFSAEEIEEVCFPIPDSELSFPALDEGWSELSAMRTHQLLVTSKRQVSLDLTPTDYPPTPPRPPHQELPWTESKKLPEVFTPSPQVSQFYYKLRAMAMPHQADETPIAADG